jgi:hypothetical protein
MALNLAGIDNVRLIKLSDAYCGVSTLKLRRATISITFHEI